MRWHGITAVLGAIGMTLAATPSRGEGIAEVLQRSQQQRLHERAPAATDTAAEQRLRTSFERLRAMLPGAQDVQLDVVGGGLFAEAEFGRRAVAASVAVGELPEGERLLMLAHELGHLQLGHWGAMRALYQAHIPGEVRPETTDPVAATLGPQAHAQSHRHEFEADAFGFALVRRLGFGVDNAMSLLLRQGLQNDSATHPGTRRRVAQLRAIDAQLGHAATHGEPETHAAAPDRPAGTLDTPK